MIVYRKRRNAGNRIPPIAVPNSGQQIGVTGVQEPTATSGHQTANVSSVCAHVGRLPRILRTLQPLLTMTAVPECNKSQRISATSTYNIGTSRYAPFTIRSTCVGRWFSDLPALVVRVWRRPTLRTKIQWIGNEQLITATWCMYKR